jgi:transposase
MPVAARQVVTVASDAFGHRRLLAFAQERAEGRRLWAIEGVGSYGAGLGCFLLGPGEHVAEVDRPRRPVQRSGAKSDELDAVRAGREALACDHLAQPRRRGSREAIRVLLAAREGAVRARTQAIAQLKALIVSAPQGLRDQLRGGSHDEQFSRQRDCARAQPNRSSTALRSVPCGRLVAAC